MLYNILQTVAVNNRGVVLYLVEGEQVELPEEEAAFVIALGYVEEPVVEPPDPPEARKGSKQKPITPEDRLEEPETR